MKIFIDAHFLDGRKHGAANFLERLYEKYRDLRPEDELIFGVEPGAPIDYELFKRDRVTVVRYRRGGAWRFVVDIPRLARELRPDIIHTQYVLPLRFGYRSRRHVTLFDVLYEDYPEYFSKLYRWARHVVFGWSARRADMLSTCSEYSRDRIRAVYRPKVSTIHVIHGGVMAPIAPVNSSPPEAQHGRFLLYVSRFERRKNHLLLLDVFREVATRHDDLRLVLVGFEVDGSLAACRAYVEAHKLERRVDVLSNISDEHLTMLFRSASVVVYPSLCEGFGMPIVESFLLNPRTLFSNTSAMSDFRFAPGNMFDPHDRRSIARGIETALAQESAPTPAWPAQRSLIADKYNWSRSAEVLTHIHSEAMA